MARHSHHAHVSPDYVRAAAERLFGRDSDTLGATKGLIANVGGQCRCGESNGDPGGNRTHNTRLKRPVLCQLSYRVEECSLAQLAHWWQAEKCPTYG